MLPANKLYLLSGIAILFHAIGLVGIGIFHSQAIVTTTPYHLLLMFVLLLVAYSRAIRPFAAWAVIAFITGFAAECIGVQTAWLFGHYRYGTVLGAKWQAVPLLIGVNWVIVLAGATSAACKISSNKWLIATIAASLATTYDWVLEPVAVKLGYWQWEDGVIPFYNYICWWALGFALSMVWNSRRVQSNYFSIILFTIQIVFFIVLRMIL